MTHGKNKFAAVLRVSDIVKITDRLNLTRSDDMVNIMDYDDLHTALVIRALLEYLEDQRCEAGFYLDLNETRKK